ncbi:hypothetical protein, partial [Escherichia coli]|uniref:hypothetical protein n=1 Tax=Escherichia coli TaxID=562 RepID=UPI0036F3B6A1
HHAFSSGAGRTSDGNGSHASTLKSPSYTKSVSWQHYQELHTNVIGPDTLWTWWGRGTNGKLKMDTVLTAPTNLNSNKDLMAITTKDLGNWITYGPSGHPISNMQGTPEKPSDIR